VTAGRSHTYADYASGHLLFLREGALMAQSFDDKALQVTGEAVQIAEGLRFNPSLVQAPLRTIKGIRKPH
jgi:hypothetical protein